MTFCGCNSINEISTGGLTASGSALVSVDTVEGGLACGGTALVEVSPDPWDGMIFVLPLNETGNEYQDRSRNNLDGTGAAALTPTVDDGVFCQPSQYFDGRDFIQLPQDNLRATQGFTVSMWVKLDRQYQERSWYTRGIESDGHNWTFSLGQSYVNHVWAKIQLANEEADVTYSVFSQMLLALDKWYFISASWTPADKLRVFINGVLTGSTETPESSMVSLTNGGYLGRSKGGKTLEGNIQDVRLHPVPRSENWLSAMYANYCDAGFVVEGVIDDAVFAQEN